MTKIEWTDATWNPVTGCTRVSPGCANCYIERTVPFRKAGMRFRVQGNESSIPVTLHYDRLDQPLGWRKPRRVFTCSMGDLLHPSVHDGFIDKVFWTMSRAADHTFQILTKRPERMLEWFTSVEASRHTYDLAAAKGVWPLPNVWVGVSVENQYWTDQRIPLLLETPAAVRFLSVEPLLHPIDLGRWLWESGPNDWPVASHELDWVIVGGESGPGARPMNLDWARSIVRQCQIADVPVFVKQLGGAWARQNGWHGGKGGDITEWTEELRVREWPVPAQTSSQLHRADRAVGGKP